MGSTTSRPDHDHAHGHPARTTRAHHHRQRRSHHQRDRRATVRESERTFDRLNPDYGVPADHHNPSGRQAVRDREAALALGVRVAVHDSRQNDPSPVIWQAGQDYRAGDAIQAARRDLVRTRHGPERVGPER